MSHLRPAVISLLALAALVALFAQGQPAYAVNITVNTTADEFGTNTSGCSLREAIQAANTDAAFGGCPAGSGADTITLPAGTYTLSITGANEDANATGDLDISGQCPIRLFGCTDDLTINGAGAGITIIEACKRFIGALCTGIDRVFHIDPITLGIGISVEISGVTIRNGSTAAAGGGGGIFNRGFLTVNSSTVSGNSASAASGGGIRNSETLTLINSTVNGNFAAAVNGGGILNSPDATLTVDSSTVSGNSAGDGGGGIANNGPLLLINSTVSGNSAGRTGGGILNGGNGTLTVDSSTVSGNSAGDGGGINNAGTLFLINNSTVRDNTVGPGSINDQALGGGILNSGTLTVDSSAVSDNSADDGGGIANAGTLFLINNSTVSGNSAAAVSAMDAASGGGILNTGSATLVLNGSTVSDNSGDSGGGINNNGTLLLINSTVSGNSAGDGGGIRNSETLTLINSTVSGNGATGDGGGINNVRFVAPGPTLLLINSTVSGNTAGASGGGIRNGVSQFGVTVAADVTITNSTIHGNLGSGISNDFGTATLKNTIVTNSTAGGDCIGTMTSAGHNLDSDGSCITDGVNNDITSPTPLLGLLQNNGGPTLTHALLAGSLAIDAGNPATPGSGGNACEATDQRGVARPQGAACDMGAFEVAARNTSVGSDVCVPMNGGLDETGGLEACFSNVTEAGITTVVVSTPCEPGQEPDTGFIIRGLGGQSTCYDINTTATFTGSVRGCIKYDPNGLTPRQQENLVLKRENRVPPGPPWTDLTNQTVDTGNNSICGDTDTLSIFTVQLPAPAVGGIAELPDVDTLPQEAAESGGGSSLLYAIAGAAAAVVALVTAGGWYARRRFRQRRA